MGEVKWIKIVTDIFDDEKILLIESMPDADSIIVLWFKLLCLAGKQNNSGVIVMSNGIAYTEPMLATIFRRSEDLVALALRTFQQYGMVEIIDATITIPNWGKHQSFDKIEAKNEYQRQYMQEYRARQRQKAEDVDGHAATRKPCKPNCKTNGKANVSSLEEDIEEERDKIREDIYSPVNRAANLPADIISFLNLTCGTGYRASSDKTKRYISARLNEGYTLDNFKSVILKKHAEWHNDPAMSKYLRPETLFGAKFESYLNQRDIPRPQTARGALAELYHEAREDEQHDPE